jgi:diphthamide synthase (EF-2-diphthine--ammonia ligase)
MFSEEGIKKLLEIVATKEDLDRLASKLVTFEEFDNYRKEIKQEFVLLRESIQALTISVDKLAKAVNDLKTEYTIIGAQISRHEKWIQQLADKLGVKLEY